MEVSQVNIPDSLEKWEHYARELGIPGWMDEAYLNQYAWQDAKKGKRNGPVEPIFRRDDSVLGYNLDGISFDAGFLIDGQRGGCCNLHFSREVVRSLREGHSSYHGA